VDDWYSGDRYRSATVTLARDTGCGGYMTAVPAEEVTLRTTWDARSVEIERMNGMLIISDAKDDHVINIQMDREAGE
jgi:hypothetical protein